MPAQISSSNLIQSIQPNFLAQAQTSGSKPVDISKLADQIVADSRRQEAPVASAKAMVDQVKNTQPKTVGDAVERSVAARLRDGGELKNHKVLKTQVVAETQAMVDFESVLKSAPAAPNTQGLSEGQRYDVYASMVEARGSTEARTDLKNAQNTGQRVVVAVRNETSTLANNGQGVYDDKVVVLSKDKNGTERAKEFNANTEPSAQYDWRGGDNSTGRKPSAGYENVTERYQKNGSRKIDGVDINKDGKPDLGALIQGTYKYSEKPGGFLGGRAFEVSQTQTVRRDVDGDGRIDRAKESTDPSGAGTTMYIHNGGAGNTWSAGCQTIEKGATYNDFLAALGQNKAFNYVLIDAK